MSKLYDVISKLDDLAATMEEDNARALHPFQVEEKSRQPLTRILLISGVLVFLGGGCLGLIHWLRSSPLPIAPQDVAAGPASSGERASVAAAAPSVLALASSPPLPNGEITVPSMVDSAFASSALPGVLVNVEHVGSAKHRIINVHPAKLIEPVVEPRPLDSSTVIAEVEEHLTTTTVEPAAQISRWLQQAEALRRNGEWESAAALFARIYERSGSPAVANNLAATLIRLQRYREAREILAEALAKTPDDTDLQQNYQLVLRQVKAGSR